MHCAPFIPAYIQSTEQQRAFSWYYFWVNVGVLAGDAGMPILQQTTGFVITFLSNTGKKIDKVYKGTLPERSPNKVLGDVHQH